MYDPRAKLDDWKEGWIGLAKYGLDFQQHAASHLVSGLPYDPRVSSETRYWLVRSALARGDAETVRIFINDWSKSRARPTARVSKFMPGDHYHVLNTKFDTLDEAIRHLEAKGYAYAGLDEKHVYREE